MDGESDTDQSALSESTMSDLNSRVTIYSDRVLLLREVVDMTPATVEVMWDRVGLLSADWDSFILIADVRAAARPDSKSRRQLTQRISALKEKMRLIVAITGDNMVIRAAAWFVMGRSGVPVQVVVDEMQALEKVQASG